jgi:hypothetical protein
MKKQKGEQLIEELLSKPQSFFTNGKSYDLLQEYFGGLDLETLIPLLKSSDEDILKPTIWIVSELTDHACSLLQYVIPLAHNEDKYIKYYALESIFMCATGEQVDNFIYLIRSISDQESAIRTLTMKLLSNAREEQLRSGMELVSKLNISDHKLHHDGLSKLLYSNQVDAIAITEMLNSNEPITQQYGVMLAMKKTANYPELMKYALLNNNPDVERFAQMFVSQDNAED